MLALHGLPTYGTVTATRKFNTKSGTRWMLVYEYNVDGQIRKHRSHLGREEFESMREGQQIALRYLPDNPQVVAPELVIAKSRDATTMAKSG